MARMNKRNAKPRNTAATPIATTGQAFTAEGGKGWQRTPKGELFLAAVTSLNEDTFYETADERVNRIQTLATLSDGTVIENPRYLRKSERRLKRAQKALSRKAMGSKRRAKARAKVARLHARVANQRQDAMHKATTWLASTYSDVSVEDLNAAINICVAGSAPETVNVHRETVKRGDLSDRATLDSVKCEPSVGGNVVSDLERVPARTPCKLQQTSL